MTELELLEKIRERPGLYLGEESITCLQAFLNGFVFHNIINGNDRDAWHKGFQDYVDSRYNNRLSIGWREILLVNEKTEEMAFRKFYVLLDEYLKS